MGIRLISDRRFHYHLTNAHLLNEILNRKYCVIDIEENKATFKTDGIEDSCYENLISIRSDIEWIKIYQHKTMRFLCMVENALGIKKYATFTNGTIVFTNYFMEAGRYTLDSLSLRNEKILSNPNIKSYKIIPFVKAENL